MKINKNNYEAFFLDYHEGNLLPQEVADLLLFVEQNPQLKDEFESFENISLEDFSEYTFENKSSLKKDLSPAFTKGEGEDLRIDASNYETYLIGSIEHNLNDLEKKQLANFLKQHPQYQTDLELFKKTKLQADASIIFEDKEKLKDIAVTADYLLIAATEGLLSNQESSMLNHQLSVDAEMNNNFNLYKQTILVADASIVYENKEELKRKNRKVIPIFYYVAAAAAVLLLFGIFSLFTSNSTDTPGFADGKVKNPGIEVIPQQENTVPSNATASSVENNEAVKNMTASVIKNQTRKKVSTSVNNSKKDSLKVTPSVSETPENKNLASTVIENKEQAKNIEQSPIKNENLNVIHNQTPAIASIEPKKESNKKGEEFLSLGQIAVSKFKEKTLNSKSYAEEKKTGRDKKLSGWDVLSVVAKGVSKVTGKKVEVEHTSAEGNVTAMR